MLNEIDLSRIDLNLLVLFEAVFEEAHVGRAADRLSLPPSAVSHGTLLDPDWPEFGYPRFEDVASADNYVAFARAHAAAGGRIERLRAGASGQLLPDLPGFAARVAAVRGQV